MTIEWISVNDRVPNNRRKVLVYGKTAIGRAFTLVTNYNPGALFECEYSSFLANRVTHWAELNYPQG